ncbi:metallophosphoesterase family protein [Candidatus Harpocratesius sp.]
MPLRNLLGMPNYVRYTKTLKISRNKSGHFPNRRIVLISDTHISSGINSSFNCVMFRKGLEEISQIPDVDYIIHLGDLTHDGTYMEYEIALDMIRKINSEKFYIIPGNHDARNVGYLLFEELVGKRTFEIEEPHLYILGVDSSIPDQNTGRIGSRALAFSEKNFEDHTDQIKIFAFHHQLIPIPYTGRERSAIYDAGDALEMALRTNVDLILNGHRHISNVYTCSSGTSDLVIFNSGTLSANKTRYRELFTYTVLDIEENYAKFITKKLMDGNFIERRRFIHQRFQPFQFSAASLNLDEKVNPDLNSVKPIAKIIHAGNSHFSNSYFVSDIFSHAVRQINSWNPDIFIFTGSLTGGNRPEEYELAKKRLAEIKTLQIILPGFKDLTKYGWDRFLNYFSKTEPNFENENLRILGLNTVDPHISNGAVGRKRMKEITEFFSEKVDSKINIIAMNHRLIPSPKLKFEKILEDSGSVLKNFTAPNNNINLILMGKNNIGFSLQLEETILSFTGSLSSIQCVRPHFHTFNKIYIFPNGSVSVYEHVIEHNKSYLLGHFWQSTNASR